MHPPTTRSRSPHSAPPTAPDLVATMPRATRARGESARFDLGQCGRARSAIGKRHDRLDAEISSHVAFPRHLWARDRACLLRTRPPLPRLRLPCDMQPAARARLRSARRLDGQPQQSAAAIPRPDRLVVRVCLIQAAANTRVAADKGPSCRKSKTRRARARRVFRTAALKIQTALTKRHSASRASAPAERSDQAPAIQE